MCGFVCLWRCGDDALARRMLDRVAHRGPDEAEVRAPAGVPAIMAHARLAIIAPDDGRQPLSHGGDWLVANGEIYNHRDLRAGLGAGACRSGSDSEPILHLHRPGDAGWVSRLDGMFAFVLAGPERIVAARDPLGIKPLYVARLGGGLAFASEVKAFDGLGVAAVEAVPPGHLFDSQDGIKRWYRLPAGAADLEVDVEAVAAELREVLERAVDKWMLADVELGSFLSGGLDSSIIAALAQARLDRPLNTFAVGTAGSPDLAAARRVADHIGSRHHEFTFTADDLAAALPDVLYHLEACDPDSVRSAMPTWFVARLACQHLKVVLTGEGADELFAGYAYHHGYAGRPRALADELSRGLQAMHNINLQRVDRVTMAHGLEARTPFLDRDLIAYAQSIPAELKLSVMADGTTVEKWILRRAVADLLPADIVWRKKAQFDEGSGAVAALDAALAQWLGDKAGDRAAEAALYERLLRARFAEPELVLSTAGTWAADRVVA
jgi:asparagine synthase (glutamine-hydrolysing)